MYNNCEHISLSLLNVVATHCTVFVYKENQAQTEYNSGHQGHRGNM